MNQLRQGGAKGRLMAIGESRQAQGQAIMEIGHGAVDAALQSDRRMQTSPGTFRELFRLLLSCPAIKGSTKGLANSLLLHRGM
jgi:hypothetical protein